EAGNEEIADNGGPKGAGNGGGAVLDKTVELDCDTAPGGFVEIGEPGQFPKLRLLGGGGTPETTPIDQNGEPTGKSGVLGKTGGGKEDDPGVGKDDPSAGKDAGKSSGKDGKVGEEPLPELPDEEVPVETRVHVKVKGKFCPKSARKLTVLFVVDYSGS